jgi:hypothetical protein
MKWAKPISRYESWWSQPVSGASLSVFRILFGFFTIFDALFFWLGRDLYFPLPVYSFKYPGFSWWPTLSPSLQSSVLLFQALLGIWMILGRWTRWAFAVNTLIITHLFLQEASFYLNHLALVWLISFACSFIRTDTNYSLEARKSSDRTIPRCDLYWVIGLFLICYLFGGLEKLRPDWFNGNIFAVNMVLRAPHSLLARWMYQPWLIQFGTLFTLVLELLGPIALLWRKTRWIAVMFFILFHFFNHFALNIGLFSFLMLAGMVLYFDSDWPETIRRRLSKSN